MGIVRSNWKKTRINWLRREDMTCKLPNVGCSDVVGCKGDGVTVGAKLEFARMMTSLSKDSP